MKLLQFFKRPTGEAKAVSFRRKFLGQCSPDPAAGPDNDGFFWGTIVRWCWGHRLAPFRRMKGKEFFDGTVVGFFDIVRKVTGGQLILIAVISDALTADPFTGAGLVGTIAMLLIRLDLAFHPVRPLRSVSL